MTHGLAALFLSALLLAAPSKKLEAGQRAFNQGDFDAALKSLDQAAVEPGLDTATLERVHLLRAQCFAAQQNFVRAEEAFGLALDANPEAALDPAKVDPSVVKILDALRARTKGTLVVESTPAGADLKLDGAPFGKAPRTEAVPVGRHKVEASYPGAPGLTTEVVVHTKGEARVAVLQAPGAALLPGQDPKQGNKVHPFADLRGVFESSPEGGLEIGGGIEVPWVRLGVYARVISPPFQLTPRISVVVPVPVEWLSPFIELEVPFYFPANAFAIGIGGQAGAEWTPLKWMGAYVSLGGRRFFDIVGNFNNVYSRFEMSAGVRMRIP